MTDGSRTNRDLHAEPPIPPPRAQGADPHRVAALAEAVPRRDHRRQVRRQRDGEPRAAARVRRGHGLPALRGIKPVVVHGGGPADLVDARAARHPERVPGRLPGDHARGHGRGPHGAHRAGQPRARDAHQRARPARRRPLRRGRRAVPRPPPRRVVDGEEVDLGLVGDVVEVDPQAVLAQLDAGRIPVVSSIAPDLDQPGQSLNVNADPPRPRSPSRSAPPSS